MKATQKRVKLLRALGCMYSGAARTELRAMANELEAADRLKGPGNPTQMQLDAATKPLHVRIETLERDLAELDADAEHDIQLLMDSVNTLERENATLRAGYPEGATPTDVRVMREANVALATEVARLERALHSIIAFEEKDMDGNPMPESGASFIARETLRLEKP